MKRRDFLTAAAAATLASGLPVAAGAEAGRFQNGRSPWPVCLDTATIRPAGDLAEKVRIAAEAGYDAIEPWDGDLRSYEESGGNLKELAGQIADRGLFVPSMIGLWGCLRPTMEEFEAALPETRARMRMASDIGCEFVQAIPNQIGESFDGAMAAAQYRRLLEIGIGDYGVKPALVFVKMFPLARFGQAAAIALDADHPEARIIPDTYHMYITGGGFEALPKMNGDMYAIFQYNDAPSGMDVEAMEDEHRVYPGDGILPLTDILRDLKASGFSRCVSLELYNPSYHALDQLAVAKTGLAKTLATIEAAGV